MQRRIFEEFHTLFRQAFRALVDREFVSRVEEWEQARIVDRGMFKKAGGSGFLGMAVPEEQGG
jgi:alkylation response protein AidB-like acyl-CoA dehydrogenase